MCIEVDGSGLHVFHHKYCVSLFPLAFPVPLEELLRLREEAAWTAYDRSGVSAYLSRIERPYRLDALLEFARDGSFDDCPAEFWETLGAFWVDSEIDGSADVWGDLLNVDLPHRTAMMSPGDITNLEALPDIVKVWRGVRGIDRASGLKACRSGHSWTTDKAVANRFAFRMARGTRSWIAAIHVPKDRIFAHLGQRGEAEAIIRPKDISDLEIMIEPARKMSEPDLVPLQEFALNGQNPDGP